MDCKLIHVEQGTDQWDDLRRTRITCSRLGDVMAKPSSKRHQDYKDELILELLGHEYVEESPEWFRHGREMEPNARRQYSFQYQCELDANVFLIHKDYDWLACSPDGLVMLDDEPVEGIEIKSRQLYKNWRAAVRRTHKYYAAEKPLQMIEPGYRFQVQGAMWLTGWDHWWYVNYYEDRNGDNRIQRAPIPRDDALIAEMEAKCLEFMAECYEGAGLEVMA